MTQFQLSSSWRLGGMALKGALILVPCLGQPLFSAEEAADAQKTEAEVVDGTTTATITQDGDLLTLTTADERKVVIDTSTLPAVPVAPTALGHQVDQLALSDSAFLHAWNEIRHSTLEQNQFLDRQVQLRFEWAEQVKERGAKRAAALAERQARLDHKRAEIEQGKQFDDEAEQAYQDALTAFKAEFAATSIVMTNEMIELLAAGKPQ